MWLVSYAVREGDTLSSIAKRFGMSWRELYEHPANLDFRSRRPGPHRIMVGDLLLVPGRNDAARRLGAFMPPEVP